MRYIDNFLNKITMYKLVLYGLFALVGLSFALGFLHILPFSGFALILSFLTLTVVCYTSNVVLGTLFKVAVNAESSSTTALILYLILFPMSGAHDFWVFVGAGLIAMTSKYVLALGKKHIFNPAAVTLVVLGIFGSGLSSWWVGSAAMLLPTVILGFLILRKVKRFEMFGVFATCALLSTAVVAVHQGMGILETIQQALISGPIVFFGTVMLTEPLTTPPQRNRRLLYGALTGLLYGAQFHIGPVYSTPALALVLGNIFSYIASPRARLRLVLDKKNQLSADVHEFVWRIENSKDNKLDFKPGQYLEWTLGHNDVDARGNRRYFTIASSPTEEGIRLGVKFYDPSSSFKKKLLSLAPGDTMIASQLAGDFVLPYDASKKLVWIAGGIGVTPFRAMVKSMLDKSEKRDVTFFFSNKTRNDVVYKDLFDEAERVLGMKNIFVVNDGAGTESLQNFKVGMISSEMIMQEVPDFKERVFYISGTHGMVTAFEDQLKKMGVPRSQIKIDFFPGFV